jgi:hypothetical protein
VAAAILAAGDEASRLEFTVEQEYWFSIKIAKR